MRLRTPVSSLGVPRASITAAGSPRPARPRPAGPEAILIYPPHPSLPPNHIFKPPSTVALLLR